MRACYLPLFFLLLPLATRAQGDDYGLTPHPVPTDTLKAWTFLGLGEVGTWGDQLYLKEAEGSKGVTLVSPQASYCLSVAGYGGVCGWVFD